MSGKPINTPESFWLKVSRNDENSCWEWQGRRDVHGYGRMSYLGRETKAHRLALMFSGCNILPGLHVLHSCDNPPCCNPKHLRPGTPADNSKDKVAKGRQAHVKGAQHPMAKYTDEHVLIMKQLWARGFSQVRIAQIFQTDSSNVSKYVRGIVRPHLPQFMRRAIKQPK